MGRQNLEEHFRDLKAGLIPLRCLLGEDQGREQLFDEFVDHGEFGLALHVVCDSLLEVKGPIVDDQTIEAVETLHEKMQLSDSCSAQLRQCRQLRA